MIYYVQLTFCEKKILYKESNAEMNIKTIYIILRNRHDKKKTDMFFSANTAVFHEKSFWQNLANVVVYSVKYVPLHLLLDFYTIIFFLLLTSINFSTSRGVVKKLPNSRINVKTSSDWMFLQHFVCPPNCDLLFYP